MNAIKNIMKSQFDTIVMTVDRPLRTLQKIIYKPSDFFESNRDRFEIFGFRKFAGDECFAGFNIILFGERADLMLEEHQCFSFESGADDNAEAFMLDTCSFSYEGNTIVIEMVEHELTASLGQRSKIVFKLEIFKS
ncbi:hypothetical protein PPUJ13061_47350 [Pseudomonas putida]|jgi:hypothetical protein|nr:hypothetical protein [Pseudomonas putida]WQE52779.1 hypothetical protein U0028_23320 [Pseudomonas putida]GLO04833.1 hypothetical protein PPUJ13061_47350 [Pseudomonas putida]HDS1007317.1 hypothetical protein [Pseudomonas putida]